MLDQEMIKIANERINLEKSDQNNRIQKETGRTIAVGVARGLSSGTALKITSIYSEAVKNRAQLVWQIFHRFITTSGISYSEKLAEELKLMVVRHLPENLEDIKSFLQQDLKKIRASDLLTRLETQIDDAREYALKKINTEIDLFIISLKNKAQMEADKLGANIFNIYSPVGSIQTGTSSVTHVTQLITIEEKDKLLNALQNVEETINNLDSLPNHPKEEIIDLVQESKIEIGKEQPNTTKLKMLLSTVGASIQTLASIKPAYEVIKQALSCLGVSLP